jgi:RNA methyltransferase, TrmH family
MSDMQHITSRDNPLIKELRRLSTDPGAYKKSGRVWVEGEHLCDAALKKGQKPAVGVFLESFWQIAGVRWTSVAIKNIVVPDALMKELSGLESPAAMGWLLDLPREQALDAALRTVVLDRLQDPGNVGSILRSAAAFGFEQIVALKGTAALWSPKVVRAGMGAHFSLRLIEACEPAALADLPRLAATSSHAGQSIHQMKPEALARANWVFGHEGQGVSGALLERAAMQARIAQPGGQESLNVAAAAAICLHATSAAALALN